MATKSIFKRPNTEVFTRAVAVGNRIHTDCEVWFHDTPIVLLKHLGKVKQVEFFTGGWNTYTTKDRMNTAMDTFGIPLRVYQKDKAWYVKNLDTGGIVPFANHRAVVAY